MPVTPAGSAPLAEVRELVVEFPATRRAPAHRIGPVSLSVRGGDRIGVVGRSGAGKTTIGSALLALFPASARVAHGDVLVEGKSLLAMTKEELRRIRSGRVAMVFQDCATAMDPLRRIDRAFADVIKAHTELSAEGIDRRSREALAAAQLDPDRCLHRYPHELSGGMRQRVMIALAIVNSPSLLVADEPTTALDPSIQIAILDLLHALSAGSGLVLITHDLRVARRLCTQIAVMDHGRVVEFGSAEQIMNDPRHEHTRALLGTQ